LKPIDWENARGQGESLPAGRVIILERPSAATKYWSVRITAAATLLLANYELTDEEFGSLLVWEAGDEAAEERWERIDEAILGVVPKPAPAT
jgi:hypothetical protein